MYNQHYTVGEKRFVGAYAALYESALTGHYGHFVIPQYHIDSFLSVDVPSLRNYSTKDLMKKKLVQLRDENSNLRLGYSGGSDSHTILVTAQEMGMKFDSIFMYTNSILPDPNVEYEYVPGMEYAKNTGMNFILHRPKISDFEYVWKDKWSFTKIDDFYHGFTPIYSDLFLKDYDQNCLEILGTEKPTYFVKGGQYYWVITDFFDWCLNRKHEDFFLGSTTPELAVKQVLLGKEYIKKYFPTTQGWIEYKMLEVESLSKYLGLHPGIDNSITKTNEDHWNFGYLNNKHRCTLKQIQDMGRQDIILDWISVSDFIDKSLKDVPFGIARHRVRIPEIDNFVNLTTNTVRTGAIFKIHEDRLELMPHNDVRKL
tara:strand:- start:934 stop:2043 length:1110 start_codon:yes stop_codon:yes gene_type:complete